MATWDDLEELSEMEEEANVCLMTKSDNEEVTLEPCSSCIRTEHFCDNLLYDSQITTQKNNELSEEVIKITQERDLYKNEVETLKEALKNMQVSHESSSKQVTNFSIQKENAKLKENVSILEKGLSKFLTSTKAFEKINGSHLSIISKFGLGFGTHQKEKTCEKSFVPYKEKQVKKLFCSFFINMVMLNFSVSKEKPCRKRKTILKTFSKTDFRKIFHIGNLLL
jgi:predicted RNase H-like nuclease (RuvC/YqgF family)